MGSVSVVVPMYRTGNSLEELHRRISDSLPQGCTSEIIYVNDGCDQGSGELIDQLAAVDPIAVALHHQHNMGQHHAIQSGLAAASGDTVIVLDADLQDPPEAIPDLLDRLATGDADAVFAGRRGAYESRARLATGHAFKWLLHILAGTPADAGGYVAMSRPLVDEIVSNHDSGPYLLACIAATRRSTTSIPVKRSRRPNGQSATDSATRLRLATQALRYRKKTSMKSRRPSEMAHRRHNDVQRAHFDSDSLENPRMVRSSSKYVERHIDRLLDHAGLKPGQRLLDVGCGLGKFSIPLHDRQFRVTGLDLSPDLLKDFDAALDGRDIALQCADILDPPESLIGKFDAAVGFFVLHHLPDLVAAFDGCRRCVRPGGTIVFLEPNAYSPLYPLQITLTPGMRWKSDKGVFAMRRAKLTADLAAAGLTDIRHDWTGLFPPAIINRGATRLEDHLDRLPLPGPVSSFQVISAKVP